LMIAFTPTWLQPTPNPCSELPAANNAHPYNSAPTNNASYASIAAQYVAHLDSKYPGLVQYYEIWNEADETNQFCGLHAGDTTQVQLRLDEYKALYVAMATAMKAQATKDGTTIKVGGPALGNYFGSNFWISQLVQAANVGTTKLADFVSYHQYPAGADVSHTMTFNGTGGTASLYARTVSPTTGLAAIYKSIAAAAGSNVPVLLDEYNDDWDFFNDCCKNQPTYSAVWNALVFTTIMNTAYTGVPPLQHLSYYSASNQPFCMLGYTGDGLYGCGATAQLPYPQFRVFELLASHNFLDLQAGGGHLALSASQTAALNTAGLVVTAFYTPGGADSVVLVNPTATAVSNKVLVMQNHGFTIPTATQYLLNGTTYSATHPVAGVAVPLTASGSSVKATVTIPPYSVLAIKVE
jgi:Glycosyl hydrolases family 39